MRKKAEAEQSRQQLASAPSVSPGTPVKQPAEPKLAQAENPRGQYGPAGGKR